MTLFYTEKETKKFITGSTKIIYMLAGKAANGGITDEEYNQLMISAKNLCDLIQKFSKTKIEKNSLK